MTSNNINNLLIDRRGDTEKSNMTANYYIKKIKKGTPYKIQIYNLIEHIDIPKKVIIKGTLDDIMMESNASKSNILGNSGYMILESDLDIPIITEIYLWYYNVKLYDLGDTIIFDESYPLFEVEIGEKYIDDYIMKKAGGVYIEKHNKIHFYAPLNKFSRGYIILGKENKDNIELSAFKIPFRKALYVDKNVIHNDCFLVGRYNVIYTNTDNYKTVLLVNKNKEPIKVTIGNNIL
jgi:hypothetical protein